MTEWGPFDALDSLGAAELRQRLRALQAVIERAPIPIAIAHDPECRFIFANRALATLKYTRKGIAEDISKVLRSAIANATNKEGFSGDVDRLYVSACYANQGPSAKRVRPAPMGRAFCRSVSQSGEMRVTPPSGASRRSSAARKQQPRSQLSESRMLAASSGVHFRCQM